MNTRWMKEFTSVELHTCPGRDYTESAKWHFFGTIELFLTFVKYNYYNACPPPQVKSGSIHTLFYRLIPCALFPDFLSTTPRSERNFKLTFFFVSGMTTNTS